MVLPPSTSKYTLLVYVLVQKIIYFSLGPVLCIAIALLDHTHHLIPATFRLVEIVIGECSGPEKLDTCLRGM
jgi:hypothetical protein